LGRLVLLGSGVLKEGSVDIQLALSPVGIRERAMIGI